MIQTAVAVYLVIGCAVVTVGPGAKKISDHIAAARGTDLTNAITGREPVPESKLIAFRIILSVVSLVLWPLLLTTSLMEIWERKKQYRTIEWRHSEGIEFSGMGGAGTIHCTACNFREDITAFMHGMTQGGERCCTTGFQCLSCGKFLAIYSQADQPSDAGTRCECGGEPSRDHILFCPKCRSKKVQYDLGVIS